MKNKILFLLLVIGLCHSSFSETIENAVEKIFNMPFDVLTADLGLYRNYTEPGEKTLKEKVTEQFGEEKAQKFCDALDAQAYLRTLPKPQLLPALASLLENKEKDSLFLIKKLPDNKSGKDRIITNYYWECVLETFTSHINVGYWLPKQELSDLLMQIQYHKIYFWYEGRKYMPEIWNNWYACWKDLNSCETKRGRIVFQLKGEIQEYTIFALPFVMKAYASGDKSLETILNYLRSASGLNSREISNEDFCKNHAKDCELPPCIGVDKMREIYAGRKIFSENIIENMKKASQLQKELYSSPEKLKEAHWYWVEKKQLAK